MKKSIKTASEKNEKTQKKSPHTIKEPYKEIKDLPKAISSGLFQSGKEVWSRREPKERREYLEHLGEYYRNFLVGFVEESNLFVTKFQKFIKYYQRWKVCLILVTGGLAILNLIAANINWRLLSLIAAVYAAILAALTNLESFFNFVERSQSSRDARELFLDAYREFQMLWDNHVLPFGDSPEACCNAAILYERIVEKDVKLRASVKELTQIKKHNK